jgi:3-phosphoshikimate 1-carboxyvinyltransferase
LQFFILFMMNSVCISKSKSKLQGTVRLPPSKSHTLRSILFASLAYGASKITNVLSSPDTEAMISACRILGAEITVENGMTIRGRGGNLALCDHLIDAQNSGQVLRFIAACGALSSDYLYITGDASIKTKRPVMPLCDGIHQLGGLAIACGNDNHAPIIVKGPIKSGNVIIDGADSQPVSALLIVASQLEGETRITVQNMGERPWLLLTLDWLKRLGVSCGCEGENVFIVEGKKEIQGFTYKVPGDLSSLAFFLVAALICESDIVIEDVDFDDVQGDKVIIEILEAMNARFDKDIKNKKIAVRGPQELIGIDIDVNNCVDALPILAVCGSFASGKTRLYNGAICRHKESDRIHAMCTELSKMGAHIVEKSDGLIIEKSSLSGGELFSWQDHRVALALSVAALSASTPSTILEANCIQKSYPSFFADCKMLGAFVENAHSF